MHIYIYIIHIHTYMLYVIVCQHYFNPHSLLPGDHSFVDTVKQVSQAIEQLRGKSARSSQCGHVLTIKPCLSLKFLVNRSVHLHLSSAAAALQVWSAIVGSAFAAFWSKRTVNEMP